MEDSREDRIPLDKINPHSMDSWKFLLKSHLSARQCVEVLKNPKPKLRTSVLDSLRTENGEETGNSRRYREIVKKSKEDWERKDRKAYDIILKACKDNESAMNIAQEPDNENFTAKEFLEALDKRFDRSEQASVVQSKERIFNSMELAPTQKVEDFIESLIAARRELVGLGCNYITLESQCKTILQASLEKDPRFSPLGNAFRAQTGTTWQKMVTEATAREMTLSALDSQTVTTPTPVTLQPNLLKKLTAIAKQLSHKKKGGKFMGKCYKCGKEGHRASDCKTSSDGKDNGHNKRSCSYCNKPGHTAEQCRKRKREQGQSEKSEGLPENKKQKNVDEVLEAILARNCMLRSEPTDNCCTDQEPLLTLDSGATAHMVPQSVAARVADSDVIPRQQAVATAKAGVGFNTVARGRLGALNSTLITDDDVLEEGVASIPQFDRDGLYVLCGGGRSVILDQEMRILASAPLENMAYKYKVSELADLPVQHRALLGSAKPEENLTLWHKRMGHHNRRNLGKAISEGKILGPDPGAAKNSLTGLCDPCVKSKHTRHSFSKTAPAHTKPKRVLQPLEKRISRVSTDLKGPVSVPGRDGELYLQIFTEDDTKWRVGKTLKFKSEATKTVSEYVSELAVEGQTLIEYHADGAPELISKDIRTMLVNSHTRVSYSPPYTPELNGTAERSNRTIWESSDAMLQACILPFLFWIFSAMYAIICMNMLPTETSSGWMTPYEAKYGSPPDVSIFRIFGCIAYVHVPAEQRTSTFADKSYKGYFVGLQWPDLDRYLVYVPSLDRVVESAHVLFDEVTVLKRDSDEILLTDPEKRTVHDFHYLAHLAYRDSDDGDILFVTTRVTTQRGFIVTFRAPVINGRLAKEEPRPIHARDAERLLEKHWTTQVPQFWDGNSLTTLCDTVYRGAPRRAIAGPDQSDALDATPRMKPLPVGVPDPVRSDQQPPTGEATTRVRQPPDPGEESVVTSTRPRREGTRREPMNVGTLGDVTERASYLAASALNVDETDDSAAVWNDAKVKEMESHILEHDTFDVVPLPTDRKAIGSKWVVKKKPDKLKARFTPKGCGQKEKVDYSETWAPVAKLVTLRVFLTLVAIMSLATCQLDLKTAFLNAFLEEEVYVRPLHDMQTILIMLLGTLTDYSKIVKVAALLQGLRRGNVLKLKKAIYGLKQAPREWWKMLDTFLRSLGFIPNRADVCFYALHLPGGLVVLLLLYVDDILLAGSTQAVVDYFAQKISETFRVSSEGPLTTYLGFDIEVDLATKTVKLSMSRYVEKMYERFKMAVKQSVVVPLQEGIVGALHLASEADAKFQEEFEYREKIGCLLYYMICMRPDICFSIGLLARFCNRVSKVAAAGVTQVLQYCYNTRFDKLVLGGIIAFITAYCDSDWATDRDNRRSQSSYILFLGLGPVDWKSSQQKITAQSTAEAEYIAKAAPVKTILWLRSLLSQTKIEAITTRYSSTLFGDNLAADSMGNKYGTTDKLKHVALKYHLIQDVTEGGVICQEHVDTKLNVADLGTKVTSKRVFLDLVDLSMGRGTILPPSKRVKTAVSDEFV